MSTGLADWARPERDPPTHLAIPDGRPSFMLMSPDDVESLEESLAIVDDDELLSSIRKSRREAAAGKTVRLRDQI